jgi:DNA-binding beta-propeller fold protein YncE
MNTRRALQVGIWLTAIVVLAAGAHRFERTAQAQAAAAGTVPSFTVDPLWPKMPPQWILGQVSGVAIDAQDHAWVLQRPWSLNSDEKAGNPEAVCCREAPPVMEFDAAGNYLQGWGGEGAGYEWPRDEHAITIDYKGNVWISSAGGPRLPERTENQILKFTRDGKFLLQIGHRGQSKGSLDTANFNTVHGVRVSDDGLVYVADRMNNRIQIFALDGTFKQEVFVERRTKLLGTAFSIAFSRDPGQQYLYLADAGNGRVHIFDRRAMREVGGFGRIGHYAGEFVFLHTVATDSKGNIYTSEVGNGRRAQKFVLANGR